ncbi:C-C chemokine receptor type 8 isoform X1 [Microcaecilia unicolor]|uniref:C-C chemokine receptor type 8-like isoform X1 n=1 Tax=Microcaecilia unicolor TaxID=1415580 RepID=A0A6P7YJB2_9AMPH|nr:C-C chemokine receptor type 8-like isoform X1 [Microcaecilia unicolor]
MEFTSSMSPLNITEYDYSYDIESDLCEKSHSFEIFQFQFLPVLFSLLFLFGLLGNVLVIWVLITCQKLKGITDVYLLNLASSDLLFVFSLPFLAHYATDEWIFGNVMCKICSGIYYTGFFSSIFFITLMSIDRYLAVVHAVAALSVRTAMRATIISIVLWLVAIFISIPNFLFYQTYKEGHFMMCGINYPENTDNQWKLFTQFEVNIVGFLVPLSIIIYCYSHIITSLQRCKNKQKTKAVKLVVLVVLVFFLFWTPFNIVVFLYSLQDLHILEDCEIRNQLDLAIQVTTTISFIHCCLNPIIYAFAGEKFKSHVKELFYRNMGCVPLCKKCGIIQGPAVDHKSSIHTQSTNS